MKNFIFVLLISSVWISCNTFKKAEDSERTTPLIEMQAPSGENASLPYLIAGEDGNLYMSWVEKRDSGWVDLRFSELKEDKWKEPELIASGNDWFVNWADYPMMAVDDQGNMIAHFLVKSAAGTYSYDVNVVYKPAGDKWSAPIIPHDDGTPTEHGFVTMLPQNDGTFLLAWLDGRNTGGGKHDSHDGHGAMTIRSALIDMNGVLSSGVELDQRICDCCQTAGTMSGKDPVIVYRDRSETEVRDISFVRRINNEWTYPADISPDGWEIAGCPVNGPGIASFENTIATAWFTAAGGVAKVKVAFMHDSGQSFEEPFVIDDSVSVGRVDIVMLNSRSVIVSWLDLDNGTPYIKYRKVSGDGILGNPEVVSQTNASRRSGFPQMELLNGTLYFAWTNVDENGTSIAIKRVEDN